jgi:hypothetical protein
MIKFTLPSNFSYALTGNGQLMTIIPSIEYGSIIIYEHALETVEEAKNFYENIFLAMTFEMLKENNQHADDLTDAMYISLAAHGMQQGAVWKVIINGKIYKNSPEDSMLGTPFDLNLTILEKFKTS